MNASVISGVDSSPVFEFDDHVFDLMSLSVKRLVIVDVYFTVLS